MSKLLVIQELQNNLGDKPSAANERPLGKKGAGRAPTWPVRAATCTAAPSRAEPALPLLPQGGLAAGARAGLCGPVSAGTRTQADGRPWIFVGPLIAQPLEAAGDV